MNFEFFGCIFIDLLCNEQQETSKTGGYCQKGATEYHVAYTDAKLAEALAKFWTGLTVASFGDGSGTR